jgi:hypothetical protein
MRTPKDVVAESRTRTKSVRSSLTATTRVTGVGTVADPRDHALELQTFSDAPVASAILIAWSADVVIVIAIGVTIGIGVVAANPKFGILDTPWVHSHNDLPGHLADVAELADAQVSEACDGDIVEVQVLSSAPSVFLRRTIHCISWIVFS